MTTEDRPNARRFGFHIDPCPAYDGAGFVCCAQRGHDGKHAITNGSTEPPYYVVVREWESESQSPEKS